MESVWADVRERLTGEHHDAIEKVVARLHVPPCPNPNPTVHTMLTHKIMDNSGMSSRHSRTAFNRITI